jgi:GTPase Era involved in 16S rRNA processing
MNSTEQKNALGEIARSLAPLLKNIDSQSLTSDFGDWCADLDTDTFSVVVVGEFNRGKSTMLNALFQQAILPVGATPTTAVVTILRYSATQMIQAHYTNGNVEKIDFSSNALEKLVSTMASPSTEIDYVEVGLPHPLLSSGIVYVDTPGVADLNRERMEVTYRFVPRADAVLFVLDATCPITRSEIDFLQSVVLGNGIDRVLFVMNFADLLQDDDRTTAPERAQNRLAVALDRDDVPVLALSAKEGCSVATRTISGIGQLEANLIALGADSTRSHEKVAHMCQRLVAILASARAEVNRKRSTSLVHVEDFNRQSAELDALWSQREARIGQISAWILDRESEILAMTRKSIETYLYDTREDIQDQIAAYSGPDFKSFVENQIPIMIKKRCKLWVDGHGDALRSLIMRLSEELTSALSREFHTIIPLLEPRFASAGMDIEQVSLNAPETNSGRVYAGLILGGASALLMLTGVGMVMPFLTLAGYPWLAGKLDKESLQEAKRKLVPEFDRAFSLAESVMKKRILGYLSEEIRGLQTSAEMRFRQLLGAARREVQETAKVRNQPAELVRKHISTLDQDVQTIEKLEVRLSEISSGNQKGATQ